VDDPIAEYRAAGEQLLAAGGYFALTEEEVLGEPMLVFAAVGTMAIGGVVVALNSWWSADELDGALAVTEPAVVLADAKRRALLADPGRLLVSLEDLLDELARVEPDVYLGEPAGSEDDPAMLMFTSGTSGPTAGHHRHRPRLTRSTSTMTHNR